jgi:hypothetical protein
VKVFFLGTFFDFLGAFRRVMPHVTWPGVLTVVAAVAFSSWIYVPLHEMLHVLGCVATGGTVERLELSPEYGAALLAKLFPFVHVGSDYAGQLVGFDTRGSDLIYLSTVIAPYLLTILVGVPLLRRLSRDGLDRSRDRLLFGLAIPPAFAPFSNMLGDYYELGSIPVSRLAAALASAADPARWRSDDLIKLVGSLRADGPLGTVDWLVLPSAFLLGTFCAFGTCWLGRLLQRPGRGSGERLGGSAFSAGRTG